MNNHTAEKVTVKLDRKFLIILDLNYIVNLVKQIENIDFNRKEMVKIEIFNVFKKPILAIENVY